MQSKTNKTNRRSPDKTVYILGAGFSKPGGAPFQKDIIKEIFNLRYDVVKNYDHLKNLWKKFDNERLELKDFLFDLFNCNSDSFFKLELEDIFTLLDKAISSNEHIRLYSDSILIGLRRKLNFCLVYMFDAKLMDVNSEFYDGLAEKIVEKRLEQDKKEDEFSFINLNWDLLFDNAINKASTKLGSDENKTALDYCFYTDPLTPNDLNIPSIRLKSEGFKNIKMLKPHGSFNWLLCKNCGKIFITFNRKIALLEYLEQRKKCNKCNANALKSVIMTPTLIKDFNNVHLGDILHNVQIELLEAREIIFVGYSLPLADLELRYLLKRSIRADATIKLIIKGGKDFESIKTRYENFFGNQLIDSGFEKRGAKDFFKSKFDF